MMTDFCLFVCLVCETRPISSIYDTYVILLVCHIIKLKIEIYLKKCIKGFLAFSMNRLAS